jgi:hypothetical protein
VIVVDILATAVCWVGAANICASLGTLQLPYYTAGCRVTVPGSVAFVVPFSVICPMLLSLAEIRSPPTGFVVLFLDLVHDRTTVRARQLVSAMLQQNIREHPPEPLSVKGTSLRPSLDTCVHCKPTQHKPL